MLERGFEQLQDWWQQRRSFGDAWFDVAFVQEGTSYLTPEELGEISELMDQLVSRYGERTDPDLRPAEALPVHMVAFAHPMPHTKPTD